MMFTSRLAGLLLAVFLLLVLPTFAWASVPQASATHVHHYAHWLLIAFSLVPIFGAAGTVTYRCPATVKATSTAPTAAQVTNLVVADVTMADGSTVTTVVHSMNAGATPVSTAGADGSPLIHIFCLTAGATPVGMGVTVSFITNAIQLTNITSAAGNGGTYRVQIWRHSIISNFTN
jgi:hypothetical protein